MEEKKISYGFADNFGFTSPFGEDSIFSQKSRDKQAVLRQQKTVEELPEVTFISPTYKYWPINTEVLLTFKVGKTKTWSTEFDYLVKISCEGATLTTNTFIVHQGYTILTKIKASTPTPKDKETIVKIQIVPYTIIGKADWAKMKESTISLKFLDSKDVFKEADIKKLKEELSYIQNYTKILDEAGNRIQHLPEYQYSYCMQAAERGLSELLGDIELFYSVYKESHIRKNKVVFFYINAKGERISLTGNERGETFSANGYVQAFNKLTKFSKTEDPKAFNEFDEYEVDHTKRAIINNSKDSKELNDNYNKVAYNIIKLSDAEKLFLFETFKKGIECKEAGYHLYYMVVTHGYHVLLLIIDNSNIYHPKYEIWDQHGLTSSSGELKDIGEGFRTQTSWTFASSCKNRREDLDPKRQTEWDNRTTRLWKIQKK